MPPTPALPLCRIPLDFGTEESSEIRGSIEWLSLDKAKGRVQHMPRVSHDSLVTYLQASFGTSYNSFLLFMRRQEPTPKLLIL